MKIELIPMEELTKDRQESVDDIDICKVALAFGIIEYSGGSVQKRLDVNEQIIKKIDKEIKRRKVEVNDEE